MDLCLPRWLPGVPQAVVLRWGLSGGQPSRRHSVATAAAAAAAAWQDSKGNTLGFKSTQSILGN